MFDKTGFLLKSSIEEEKNGTQYSCSISDKVLLQEMMEEINEHIGTNLHYLAELDHYDYIGSGEIVAKYIKKFDSEGVKAYLLSQMVTNRIKDCGKIILELYQHFKESELYIPPPEAPSPLYIYVRYDNAIRKLKPKRIKSELMELAVNPRDACYLPFTMIMLASWKIPDMKDVLISYLDGTNVTAHSVGIMDESKKYYPSLDTMKRELKFTAIAGLKYYPSAETNVLIKQCADSDDLDIQMAAKKTLKVLERSNL